MSSGQKSVERSFVSVCNMYTVHMRYYRAHSKVGLICCNSEQDKVFVTTPALSLFRSVVEGGIAEALRENGEVGDSILSISLIRKKNDEIDLLLPLSELWDFLDEVDINTVHKKEAQ